MDAIVTISPSVSLTPTGLEFRNSVSFDEWQTVGLKLREVRGMIHWWIGDWLNYGEERWGEMYAQAVEDTQYRTQTLMNDKYVASRFQISRRREKLSWSHHADVAGLDVDEQEKLLNTAEEKRLARGAFRELVANYKNGIEEALNLKIQVGDGLHKLLTLYRDTLTPRQQAAGDAFFDTLTTEEE